MLGKWPAVKLSPRAFLYLAVIRNHHIWFDVAKEPWYAVVPELNLSSHVYLYSQDTYRYRTDRNRDFLYHKCKRFALFSLLCNRSVSWRYTTRQIPPPPQNFARDSVGMFQRIGEICPRVTWTGLGSSQGLRSERSAINRLNRCSEFCRKVFLELIHFRFLKSSCGSG